MKIIVSTVLVLLSCALFTGCKKDDDKKVDSKADNASKKYTLAFKSLSAGEPEYLVEVDDLMTGEINAVNGIEQIGWRYMYSSVTTLFSSGYVDENICASYKRSNGSLALNTQFVFDNSLNLFGNSEDGTDVLAMEVIYVGDAKNKLYRIDAVTGAIKDIKYIDNFYDSLANTTGYPTALLVSGNQLFIPFIKYDDAGSFSNPVSDTAFVAVYSYPEMKFEKYIKDGRTGYIGVHGSTTGMIKLASGDLYSSSSTSVVAGMTAADKPSGILKIKEGETEFDPSYFFNIEAATGGAKIFRMHSVGNGKVFARLITNETVGSWGSWTAYSRDPEAFTQKGVIIDLEAKTVTDITNLPLHAKRYTAPVYVENGKIYLSIETSTEAYIYQVDIATASATKGAKIAGKTVKGIFSI
jgi:hypothetical protein